MSLIGKTIIANLTDDFGEVTSQVTGKVVDKVLGVKKVYNQLPQGNGREGNYLNHVVVDYYLLQEDSGIVKVEATQFVGYPKPKSKPDLSVTFR